MRVATAVGVLLLGGAASLSAQHAHQFEIGGFASYTRFDRAFLLDNQIGGGGRLGFWITDWLGIEGDGLYMRPKSTSGSGTSGPVWFASGSLVLNFGSEKSFYLLGGYSAMDFNSSGVGGFRDAGAHAALGDRIYITDRAALRLEGRAYYAATTQLPGSKWAGQLVGSAGLSFFLGPTRREKIYPEIPKQRPDPTGAVEPGNVQFNNLRRLMVGVLAFPAQLRVEPFAGGGFAIMEALNVEATSCTGCSGAQFAALQDAADNAATKAFFWWMGGIDIKQGRLALYGHYILTSSAATFLIQGTTHTFQGGVRYSFGSAKEGITDRQ